MIFAKKAKEQTKKPAFDFSQVRFTVIPDIFYNGHDPSIYDQEFNYQRSEVFIDKTKIKSEPQIKQKVHTTSENDLNKGEKQKVEFKADSTNEINYTTNLNQNQKQDLSSINSQNQFQKPKNNFVKPLNSSSENLHLDKPNHKILYIFLIIIVIFGGVGIVLYYTGQFAYLKNKFSQQTKKIVLNKNSNNRQETKEKIANQAAELDNTEKNKIKTEITNEQNNLSKQNFFTYPEVLLINTSDLDNDELTDVEEELFLTDSGNWDTDNDNYYDGLEVYNLYNPKGLAPRRLIESNLVKEYNNPVFNYYFYYPKDWQIGELNNYKRILVSSIDGDYIEIITSPYDKKSFNEWFMSNVINQYINDYNDFTNKFNYKFKLRKDKLVAFLFSENKNQVYIFIYQPKEAGPIKYRHIMQMLVQSFRLSEYDLDKYYNDSDITANNNISTSTNSNTSSSLKFINTTTTEKMNSSSSTNYEGGNLENDSSSLSR